VLQQYLNFNCIYFPLTDFIREFGFCSWKGS